MTLGIWHMLAWLFVAAGWWSLCAHLAARYLGGRGYLRYALVSAVLTVPLYGLAAVWGNGYVLYWFWTGLMLTLMYLAAAFFRDVGDGARFLWGRR